MAPPLPGVLKPPPQVVAALKRVNPRLEIMFNDQRGRWVIYERVLNGCLDPVRVLEDVRNDREFVALDMGVVEDAVAGDTWRKTSGAESVLDEIQQANGAMREEGKAQRRAAVAAAVDEIMRAIRGRRVIDLGRGGLLLPRRKGLVALPPGARR